MTGHLPSVTIVRRIKAAPAKVWAAITQSELMMQWWGPDAGPTLSVVADVCDDMPPAPSRQERRLVELIIL